MNPAQKINFKLVCAWAGWTAFFSPAAFMLCFFLSLFRDNYGASMALVGKLALHATFAVPIVGFVAGLVALIGASIYKENKMRVQAAVGVFGALVLLLIAILSGITTATIMVLGASRG